MAQPPKKKKKSYCSKTRLHFNTLHTCSFSRDTETEVDDDFSCLTLLQTTTLSDNLFKTQSCWKKMIKENTLVLFCLCFCHLVGVFGDTDTVKSVSVKEGGSVTLQINVTELQTRDEIEWTFGTDKKLIANINGKTSKIFDGPDGRFRDRLKLDHQTGSLIITDTRITDSGLYEVTISSSSEEKYRFNVTVNDATTPAPPSTPPSHRTSHPTSHPSSGPPSGSPADPPSGSPNFLIVLISTAAAGSLLVLVAVGIICICRKQRTSVQHVETHEEVITYADPTFHKRKAQKLEDDVVYASVVHRR
uniref:Immunoglobulin domain-containing protein n=1 Tax=Cyprinus carpio carpio TaxID=630221 RepID=A0A9J8DD73_CYPCA